jgi:microsomal dipeptidase-like Zn-dependent dipeptidase
MTPVYDLHCDMPAYLAFIDKMTPNNEDDIGCAFPHLKRGNVKLQVMAIFSPPNPMKKKPREKQVAKYLKMLENFPDVIEPLMYNHKPDFSDNGKIKVVSAIENATVFCGESESLQSGFRNLEQMIEQCGLPLYIGFTHWSENRFGGGNDSHVGLKKDGQVLLEYLSGKKIAVDFAHASDELAFDILNYIDRKKLDIPVIASHSNFRYICDHERNLPDPLATEIIQRNGLIGLNFMRSYIDTAEPRRLIDHILYGLEIGAAESLAFGADFFYEKPLIQSRDRDSSYFPEYSNAGAYQEILAQLKPLLTIEELENIAWKNAKRFIEKLWR